MRHTSAFNVDQGFSILEMLTVLIIVGILSTLAAPSFLGWIQRQQIEEATTDIEGALKEAQRQAIANSQTCSIDLNVTDQAGYPKITSSSSNNIDNCLFTGDRTLENVELASSATSLSFDYKGEVATGVTITLTHQGRNNPKLQRCLVVSSPLGLIRKGRNPNNGVCEP